MKRAMHANASIQVYEADGPSDNDGNQSSTRPSRFGPYRDVIQYCTQRNRASLVASALLMVAHEVYLGATTWHAILLHMAAQPERQSALFQVVQRVFTDPHVSLVEPVAASTGTDSSALATAQETRAVLVAQQAQAEVV